jgi:UDP-N-acetylglucosamine diphosphorylase / glucose-1-phosphate thymidylyltransferase / UDP-N-acetylgalactosamine diphosphorylase / glucosamine-1-phosphate N-acetyltransferase / galactosamine-1-phosphate N-acetyltransferase
MKQVFSKKQAVILAAGQSSRFWPLNQQHKSLFKIMGRPLIYYTLAGVKKIGVKEVIVIQGPEKDIEKELKLSGTPTSLKVKYIVQPKAKGMGDALWQARKLLKSYFLVLNAERVDIDEMVKESQLLLNFKNRKKPFLIGQKTENPELFGLARLKGNKLLGITEKPRKGKEPSNIRVLGAYLLEPGFFDFYSKAGKEEYNFEKALSLYAQKKEVEMLFWQNNQEAFSLKYPWHLFKARNYLFDRFLEKKTSKNAWVSKKAVVEGKVYIGKRSKISAGAFIKGPCYIGDDCFVGNNSVVRDYTNMEKGSLVGALAEVTRSVFQENVHIHSGFFGDSIFDCNCRIGAGTITANVRIDRKEISLKLFSSENDKKIKEKKVFTGSNSLGVITGQDVKIGINSSLMPGKLIGSNCSIGPGSLVLENMKDGSVFYSQIKNRNKK